MPAIARRHDAMNKAAEAKSIPHEVIMPDDSTKQVAAKRFEEFARTKTADAAPSRAAQEEENGAGRVSEILRRQAINYYFLEHPPKSVTPERLADFLAAFPPWLQSAFDTHPPDEAQRRLTIVYRLVFPHPAEIKPSQRPAAAAAAARPATATAGRSPRGRAKPPSRSGTIPSEPRGGSWRRSCREE